MRQRKKKRKQIYTEPWDMDTEQLRCHLNVFGVDGVAAILDCDRTTVWRATRANGLKRGKGGRYAIQPPDPNNPDEADAHLKMLQARPRGGPSIVVIDAQVGQRTRALSIFCKHEWETLVYEGPIPSVNRGVTRCKWCLGVRPY